MWILVSGNKNLKVLLITFFLALVIFLTITILRFVNPIFRINFDMIFNNSKENVTYENGKEYYLPLPKDTVQAYRYSDYGVMYYTKLSYDEFIEYYNEYDYIVKNNDIVCNDVKYILKEENDYMGKYTAIRIEMLSD